MAGFEIGLPTMGSFGISGIGGGPSLSDHGRFARFDRDMAKQNRAIQYRQALDFAPEFNALNEASAGRTTYSQQTAHYKAMRDSGLHPAFASGSAGGGGSSSPVLAGGMPGYMPGRGKDNGVASFKKVNKYEALINKANLGLLKAKTDEIQERIDASKAARADTNGGAGVVEIVPDQITSANPHDRSETAGKDEPAWKSFKLGSGKGESIVVPAKELDSIWDSFTVWGPILSVKENREALHRILKRKSYEAWQNHPLMIAGRYLTRDTMTHVMERLGKGRVKTTPVKPMQLPIYRNL